MTYLKKICAFSMMSVVIACIAFEPVFALSVTATFTKLSGSTGGSPALTGVYRAGLSGLGLSEIQSISIQDNSGGLGGATGQFSGFDFDAIILSTTSVGTAGGAAGLTGISAFDFSSLGTTFTPGVQRPPTDPALFGTTGGNVNNAVATLGVFDGNATTAVPPAFPPFADGFLSMGDNGRLTFNLTSAVSTTGLFLYIGEVGDNGEVAAGAITVSDVPTNPVVPEPSTVLLFGTGLAGLAVWRMGKKKQG